MIVRDRVVSRIHFVFVTLSKAEARRSGTSGHSIDFKMAGFLTKGFLDLNKELEFGFVAPVKARLHRRFLSRNSMQFLSRRSRMESPAISRR